METSIQEQADAGIEVVNARLNYLADATPKPVNYAYDPPAGVPRRSGNTSSKASLSVTAAKCSINSRSTPTVSFSTEHETAVKDFYDPTRSNRSTTPKSSAC